eukprot:231943_1
MEYPLLFPDESTSHALSLFCFQRSNGNIKNVCWQRSKSQDKNIAYQLINFDKRFNHQEIGTLSEEMKHISAFLISNNKFVVLFGKSGSSYNETCRKCSSC